MRALAEPSICVGCANGSGVGSGREGRDRDRLARVQLDGRDPKARLAANATSARRPRPEVRNRIADMLERSAPAALLKSDPAVRRAAADAVLDR
jgi:hypothetical protein